MAITNPESLWDYPEPNTTNTINLNQDQGLSDGDEIDSYLQTHMADNTRIEIEPGSYDWAGDPATFDGEYNDCEVVGTGDPGMDNIQFNLTTEGVDPYGKLECSSGTLKFKNITLRGRVTGDNTKLRFEAIAEDAEIIMEHIWMPDGQVPDGSGDSNGMYAGSDEHIGTIRVLWCHVEDFGDNGMYLDGYAGSGLGQVIIVGGLTRNNNISNCRIGNDDSVVYRHTSVHDSAPQIPSGRTRNQRGIRVRQPGTNIRIDDCDVYHTVSSWDPIVIDDGAEGGDGEIDDTRIHTESDIAAVREKGTGAANWTGGDIDVTGGGNHEVELPTVDDLCQGSSCDMAGDATEAWFNLDGSGGGGGGGGTTTDDSWERRYTDYIENWDTTDPLALWEAGDDGSGKQAFSVVTSPVQQGSQALEVSGASPGFGYIAAPGGSDFYNLPNAQDDFEFWFYPTGTDGSSGVRMGFASNRINPFEDYYRLQISNYEMEIDRFGAGSSVESFGTPAYDFTLDGWNRVEVQQDGDGFRVIGEDADGVEQVNFRVDDTTYGGDGIVLGVVGGNAYTHYVDGIRNLEAQPDELVDNFDDQDIAEYTVQSSVSGDWSLDTTHRTEASASLRWDHTSNGTTSTITSNSGLDNYPQAGDTFGFSFYMFGNSVAQALFGVESGTPGNRWEVELDRTVSPAQVRVRNTVGNEVTSVDYIYEEDIWTDVVVEWRDANTIQVDVTGDTETASLFHSDTSGTTPSGTGVGWSVTAGTDTDARWNFDEEFISGTLIGGGGHQTNDTTGARLTNDSTGAIETRGGN